MELLNSERKFYADFMEISMIILSHFQANQLVEAYKRSLNQTKVSLNLGISLSGVKISDSKFLFFDGQSLSLEQIKKIRESKNVCFFIENNQLKKIQTYSHKTKRFYKLFPTGINTAPSVEISGIRMHAVKDTNPIKDAQEKISVIKPIKDLLLDTCTGLGYTAILTSKYAQVYTYEKDENIIEIAKYNPWSKELFANKNIKIFHNDISKEIKNLRSEFFNNIIHDPPSFKICSELYTGDFYKELYRVLKQKGEMYHYIGSPGAKKGVNIEKGVINRLRNVGFKLIRRVANGVVVTK